MEQYAILDAQGKITVGLPPALRGHGRDVLAGLGWKPLRWTDHPFDPDTQYRPEAPSYSDQGDHILGDHPPVAMPAAVQAARARSLADGMKAERCARVDAELTRQLEAGFLHAGQRYQIDGAARQAMASVLALLQAGVANAHGGAWRTTDNTMVAMDDADCRAFLEAALARVQHLKAVAWAKKDAILAADTPAAVTAVSTTDGWEAEAP